MVVTLCKNAPDWWLHQLNRAVGWLDVTDMHDSKHTVTQKLLLLHNHEGIRSKPWHAHATATAMLSHDFTVSCFSAAASRLFQRDCRRAHRTATFTYTIAT